MAIKVGDLFAVLGLDKKGFTTGLKQAGDQSSAFGKATDKTFALVAKAAKIAFAAVSAAVIKSVIDAMKFEAQMANVATMLDKRTMPMLAKFKKEILDASKKFGEGTKTLTKGLYDILSASIPAEKAIDVLNVSVLAAKAGMTDAGTAADVITTLLNAYGEEAEHAAYVSDILFATVKKGKTTFRELASTMGVVATLGAKAGVSLEELGAMMAIMTRNGLSSEQAATALRGAITGLLKPSEEATEIARELGIEFGISAIEAHGLEGVMENLGGLPADVLSKLFPNIRGLTAVVVAAGELTNELEDQLGIMEDGSPTMEAWEKQAGTMQVAWDRLKATFKAVSINMGDQLLPTVRDIIDAFRQWLDENEDRFIKFAQDLLETLTDLVAIIIEWKEVVFAAAVAIGSLMIAQKVTTAIKAMSLAFKLGAGPIGLVITGLTTLVWIITKVVQASKEFKEDQQVLSEALKGTAKDVDTYSDAQDILNKKLRIAKKEYDSIADAVVNGVRLGEMQRIGKQKQIEQIEKEIKIVEENKKAKLAADAAIELAGHRRAEAELKAQIATQKRILEEIAADETREQAERDRAAAERQRLAAYEKAMDVIREAEMTEEQRIKEHGELLKELGLTEADIIKFLRITYAEYYAEKKELREKDEKETAKGAEERAETESKWRNYLLGVLTKANKQYGKQQIKKTKEIVKKEKGFAGEVLDAWMVTYNAIVTKVGEVTNVVLDSISGMTGAYFGYHESILAIEDAKARKSIKIATDEYDAQLKLLNARKKAGEDVTDAKIALEEQYEAEVERIDKEIAEKKWELEVKQFKVAKMMNIAQVVMSTAVGIAKALPNFILAAIVAAFGAVQVGYIAAQKAPPKPAFEEGGLFEGKPGIDTNVVALTSGEYVVNKDATARNMDTLEAINAGEEGGGITIMPMPLTIQISDREVGSALIEFLTEESDRGSYRINPKVIRSNI